jgi:NADH-quinone oxidoreductase subunit N
VSTPFLFIIIPLIISALLLIPQKNKTRIQVIGIITCGFLATFSIFQEFGEVLKIGPISLEINSTMSLFGRSFILANGDRFFLSVAFLASALWFGIANLIETPGKYVSLGLSITSILTAALAVEPFIYSAILVELAVLLAILLATQVGKPISKGIIRFLIFQSLAMPFILFGGWLFGGIQASPSDIARLSQADVFLGMGFAFWLAVFPFQSWVPLFTKEVHPLVSGLIFTLFPMVALFLMIDFISGLIWLRESTYLAPALRSVGLIMIITTGVWTAFESDLKRIFGYTVLFETGFSLIMISFQSDAGLRMLLVSMVPRIIGLATFGLSLSILVSKGYNSSIDSLNGVYRKLPFVSIALVISLLSIVGIPLLAVFPVRLAVFEQLAKADLYSIIWCLVGIAGFFFATLRIINSILFRVEKKWHIQESITQIIFICIGVLLLLVIGIVPGVLGGETAGYFSNLPIMR